MILKVHKGVIKELDSMFHDLSLNGVVVFSGTKAAIEIFYTKHFEKHPDYKCALSYIPDEEEGYYYFVCDLDTHTCEQARKVISKATLV